MKDWLDPAEAARLFRDDPTQIVWPLGYFIARFGMTHLEVLGELRAGRLIAEAPKGMAARTARGERVNADEFIISGEALTNWIANPKTPPHLVKAFRDAVDHTS